MLKSLSSKAIVFSNFERARRARSRIAENIEFVKICCQPSEAFGLPICLCVSFNSVFTNFHYRKLKNKHQYL